MVPWDPPYKKILKIEDDELFYRQVWNNVKAEERFHSEDPHLSEVLFCGVPITGRRQA